MEIVPQLVGATAGPTTRQLSSTQETWVTSRLEQVVEAARAARSDADGVRFVLMGDGNQQSDLERRAAGLSILDFRPFEPSETFRTRLPLRTFFY